MISPEQRKILSDLGNTQYGHALKSLLNDKLDDLNSVSTIKSWDEALGRQYADKLIRDIFGFMGEFKESKKKTRPYD